MLEAIQNAFDAKVRADEVLADLLDEWAIENCPFSLREMVYTQDYPGKWEIDAITGVLKDGEPDWELHVVQLDPDYWIHIFTVGDGVMSIENT